mgnify:CR=1 FL=1
MKLDEVIWWLEKIKEEHGNVNVCVHNTCHDMPCESFLFTMKTDELSDTLNYAQAARIIKEEMQVPSKLMEHVAGRVVQRLQNEFPTLQRLSFTIAKENPPVCAECASASITVEISVNPE